MINRSTSELLPTPPVTVAMVIMACVLQRTHAKMAATEGGRGGGRGGGERKSEKTTGAMSEKVIKND